MSSSPFGPSEKSCKYPVFIIWSERLRHEHTCQLTPTGVLVLLTPRRADEEGAPKSEMLLAAGDGSGTPATPTKVVNAVSSWWAGCNGAGPSFPFQEVYNGGGNEVKLVCFGSGMLYADGEGEVFVKTVYSIEVRNQPTNQQTTKQTCVIQEAERPDPPLFGFFLSCATLRPSFRLPCPG